MKNCYYMNIKRMVMAEHERMLWLGLLDDEDEYEEGDISNSNENNRS